MMRLFKRLLIIGIAVSILIGGIYVFWLSPRYTVPILMYHRFGYEEGSLFVTPENFRRQMAYLKRKNFNVISLDELVSGIKANRKFRHNTVVITVDDGYRDVHTCAYPVLKRHNFPATIFVAAGMPGKNKEFLTWEQAVDMTKDNIALGGHTINHAYLPSINDEAILWNEIASAKKIIETNTGARADYFCYPTGGFNEKVKEAVRRAGYKGACTTNRGLVDFNKDVYELKRVKITNSDINKPLGFRAKLSGYYNLFRTKKSGG